MEKKLRLPSAEGDLLWVVIGNPWAWVFLWLLMINIVTFFAFGIDKWKAKRAKKKAAVRRIPERTLFLLSVLGGSVGALLGMKVWHHKTLHKSFCYGIPAILTLQVVIPMGIWIYKTVLQ